MSLCSRRRRPLHSTPLPWAGVSATPWHRCFSPNTAVGKPQGTQPCPARPPSPITPPTWKMLPVAGSGTPSFLQPSRGGGVPVVRHRSVTGWRRATVMASPSAMLTEGRAGQRGDKAGGKPLASRAHPDARDGERVAPRCCCAHLAPKATPEPGHPQPGCCPGRRRALGGRALRGRSAGSRRPQTPPRRPLHLAGVRPSATCKEQGGAVSFWGVPPPPPTLVCAPGAWGCCTHSTSKASRSQGEQDPRDQEQELMPPVLKDTSSQGSPSPIWSPHPAPCCISTCQALGCPQGAAQPPKAAQGDVGRTPPSCPTVLTGSGARGHRWHGSECAGTRWPRQSGGFPHRRSATWGELEKRGKRGQLAGSSPGSLALEQPGARRAQDPRGIPKPTAMWSQIRLHPRFSDLREAAGFSHLLPATLNPRSLLQPRGPLTLHEQRVPHHALSCGAAGQAGVGAR